MKIDLDTLIDIIFDESSLWQEYETSEDMTDNGIFKLQWSGCTPDRKSRYLLITDSEGKSYTVKVSLTITKSKTRK